MTCLGVMLGAVAVAQVPGLGAPPKAPDVPATLANPRATMRTFLEGMNDADVQSAVTALDLKDVAVIERAERGPQMAFRLWAVLNRQKFIQLEEVPDSPGSTPFAVQITDLQGGQVGTVRIDKGADGAYRFTAGTLSNLGRLWEGVRDKPVVPGLLDPSLRQFDPAEWFASKMPPATQELTLGVAQWKWLLLAIILFLGAVAGGTVRLVAQFLAGRIFKLKRKDTAYREIERGGAAVSLIIWSWLVARTYTFLGLPGLLSGTIGFVALVGEVWGCVRLAMAVWDSCLQIYARREEHRTGKPDGLVIPVLTRLGNATILIVAALSVMSFFGVNVTGFVATLGLGGLVLALAAKDSVENLFGSVVVLVEKPFKLGDWIKIGDVSGEVEDIRLRSTRIRTFEDSVIVMPNSALVSKSLENFGMRRYRRLKTTIGVPYDTHPAKIDEFTHRIREMLYEHPHVWNDKRFVYLNDFGASALEIQLLCYLIAPTGQLEFEYRNDLLLKIVKIADEIGVHFAFPTQTLYVKDEGGKDTLFPPSSDAAVTTE